MKKNEITNETDFIIESDTNILTKERIKKELDKNFLVEAVPGSGKTYNLVKRMISLVLSGVSASSIAAITFTRKAAEELRSRFREELENHLAQEKNDTQQKLLNEAISKIEDGYIGTIHGFCARILREYPIEAMLDPSFIELEETQEKTLFRRTWAKLLSEHHEFVKPFAEHMINPKDGKIIDALHQFCQYPDADFSIKKPVLPPNPKDMFDKMLKLKEKADTLDPRIKLTKNELEESIASLDNWIRFDNILKTFAPYFEQTEFTPEDLKVIWRTFRYRYKITLACNLMDKTDLKALKEPINEVNEAINSFLKGYNEYLLPIILPALEKIREIEQTYRNNQGYVSYLDLLYRTVQLIKNNSEIRIQVQKTFPFLLIDEFQDTDPLQAEMAFLLTSKDPNEKEWLKCSPKPGSLFLVGDPKQSVYRFRRADIEIYSLASKQLVKSGGEILSLTQNRRSLSGICSWVNKSFSPIFNNQKEQGQTDFAEMAFMRKSANFNEPTVFGLQIPNSISGAATTQMSEYDSVKFAQIINSMLGKSHEGIKDGKILEPDDFILLCRNNKKLITYALELEKLGIQTNVSGGGDKLAEILKKDFISLYLFLRALIQPSNSPIVWAVLVGPIFGLSDEEIWEHVNKGGKVKIIKSLEGATETEKAINKLVCCRKFMTEFESGIAFRKIVQHIGFDSNLQLQEFGSLKNKFLNNVEKLFDNNLFSEANDILGEWFKNWPISDYVDEPGCVRLMTMHKAKGLEAPVVLVGGISRDKFYEPKIMLSRETTGDYLNPTKGYLRLAYGYGPHADRTFAITQNWDNEIPKEKQAEENEAMRLAYVACTRARDLLIISRHTSKKGKTTTPFPEALSGAIAECPEFDFSKLKVVEKKYKPVEALELEKWEEKIENWLCECKTQTYSDISVTEFTEKKEDVTKDIFSKKSDGGRDFGNFVHLALCDLMRMQAKKGSKMVQALIDYMLADSPALVEKKDSIITCVNNVLEHKLWGQAMSSAECHSEVPVASLEEQIPTHFSDENDNKTPVFMNGVIDLIFKVPGGWKIVDYKTNVIDDENHRERVSKFYAPQLTLYGQMWEKITGEKVVKTSLLYVRDGKEVELV